MSGDLITLQSGLELPGFLLKAGEAIARGDPYFRDVLEALPAAIYTTDAAGRITYYNQAAALLWGQRPELGESEWCGSWKLYWPDGRPLPHDQCPMALAIKEGRPNRGMEAVAERPDGIKIPFIPYPTPLFDSSGTLVGAVNMLVDITDRKRAEEALQLIVDESKHRIRNTLATVQAIATHTLHASDEERLAFVARLSALGRAHDLLSVENWSRAKIGDVVNQALAPFRDKAYERFVVEGPEDLWTSSNHASLLTMALHELATNASKYGALANNSGQVRLSWELVSQDQESRLRLCWTESGGPPVTAPSHAGFGSFLMNRVLKAERGEVRLEYKPQGLVATLELTS